MLHFVTQVNRRLLWLNLLLLLRVVFIPFPTSLMGTGFSNPLVVRLYGLSLIATNLSGLFFWLYAARWWAGRLVGTRVSCRVERALTRPSLPLNDEDCFVVNLILLSHLPQTVIFFCGVFQHRSADVSR